MRAPSDYGRGAWTGGLMSDGTERGEGPGQTSDGDQPRRSGRVELDAEVLVRRTSGNSYRVRVFDLSPHGCKVEFIEGPTLDERIWIKIPGLDGLEGMVGGT